MSKDKLEQMRDRLDVNAIEYTDRKKLFDKFQEAGGEVGSFKDDTPASNVVEESSIEKHDVRPSEMENPFHQDAPKGLVPIVDTNPNRNKLQKVQSVSIFKMFFVRFACFLANLFNFSATRFSERFTNMSARTAYQELSTLKSFLESLFKGTSDEIETFKESLAENNLLPELEYAYYAYHLISEEQFQKMSSAMARSVDHAEGVFCDIFRELSFFFPYQKRMQTSIYAIARKYEEQLHKKIYAHYDEKKVSQIFNFIWMEWYIWIEELVSYYWTKHNFKISQISLEDFLYRGKENKTNVGSLAKKWAAQYSVKEKQQENQPVAAPPKSYPNENIEKGVLFIKNYVNFEQYKKNMQETKDLRSLMPITDKLFYTFSLVDFFDKEFGLAWNEINFYVIPDAREGRFDPGKEIKLLHAQLMQFDELINEFLRTIRSTNASTSPQETKDKEISRSSYNARKMVIPVMEEYRTLFSRMLKSKGKEEDCIGNWDEILFNQKNQNHRALHGYKTEHIVSFAYAYIEAVVWLLKYSDLSGLDGATVAMEVLPDVARNND